MPRTAFRLRLKSEAIEEYERAHREVWPELLTKLKAVGISDYPYFAAVSTSFWSWRWTISRLHGLNWRMIR